MVVTNEIFENTLIALNKTLNFIFLEYKSINVDGLLGVNIANGFYNTYSKFYINIFFGSRTFNKSGNENNQFPNRTRIKKLS